MAAIHTTEWGVFKHVDGTYSGQWSAQHSRPEGYGTMVYSSSDKEFTSYSGHWKAGHRDGFGVAIYKESPNCNYKMYSGEWRDGFRSGHGTLMYHGGGRYDGNWKDNIRHGYGILISKAKKSGNWVTFRGEYSGDKKRSGLLSSKTQQDRYISYYVTFLNGKLHDLDGQGASVIIGNYKGHRKYKEGWWVDSHGELDQVVAALT